MIFWILLFILAIVISFVLSLKSMQDYQEIPSQKKEYSLFLIRQSVNLNGQLLNALQSQLKGELVSFERLIKGDKSALVVFGPKGLLLPYQSVLNLLELEDYTNVENDHISVWEVIEVKNFPVLEADEQFWYQLILLPNKKGFQLQKKGAIISNKAERRIYLSESFVKLPKAFSNDQLIDFYQKRSFQKEEKSSIVSSEAVLKLLSIS